MSELAVGLMSGTSLDGVDAALVRINGPSEVALEAFHTHPYSPEQRNRIVNCIAGGGARDLALLNVDMGAWFADAVSELLRNAAVDAGALSFIASHGHTVWHEPARASLQLGDPAVIAEMLSVCIVSNFRSRDVAAGGQGAPLVPIADVQLFGSGEHERLLLNIGGIANVTWVPRRGSFAGVIAFDTGPGVAVIDATVRMLVPPRTYDESGAIAAKGRPIPEIVNEFLQDEFFSRDPPKSTGRERFGDSFAAALVAAARERANELSDSDLICTATALTAEAIRNQIERWVPHSNIRQMVVSGGGVHNVTLMGMIRASLPEWKILKFDELFFDGDAKEAVAFAYLGWSTLNGEPQNLSSATGAAGPRVLGTITPA